MTEYLSESPAQTESIARELAGKLRNHDVLAFVGGLGMGKTAFVRGLAQGLGVDGEVASPTFSIVNEYPGKIPLYHFDMYRVGSLEDLYTTGFFDYLDADGILAVEWSENIAGVLPETVITVSIERAGDNARKITIEGDARF